MMDLQSGWTSLMKASFEGHEKIVVILLAAGAKPDNSGLV
jgi:ankyrin repeat protein